MPQLTIYFFGLICHVGDLATKKKFALLVRDADHNPFITDGTTGFTVTSDIRLSTGAGVADADADFKRFVPSLKKLFDEDLDPTTIPTNAFKIDYPDRGALSVASLYPCKAIHLKKGSSEKKREECVARVVQLIKNVPANTIVQFTGGSYPVTTDKEILVSNAAIMTGTPQPCGLGHSMGHVNAFKKILNPPKHDIEVEEAGACDTGRPPLPRWIEDQILSPPITLSRAPGGHAGHSGHGFVTMSSIHVECGNTDLP